MEYFAFPNVKTVLRDLYGMEPKVLSPVGQNTIALIPIKAAAGRVRTTLLAEFRFTASQVNLKLTAVLCRCRLNHPLKTIEEDTIEIVGFHPHIYFDTDSRDAAARVREGLSRFEVQLGRWHDKPICPHPEAMYQVAFLPQQFGKVVPWLMLHQKIWVETPSF
jgi:Aromatic ring-cleaving dioxygenase